MKKKLLIILFTFISIFIFNSEISARECKYSSGKLDIIINTKKEENGNITMTYNKDTLLQTCDSVDNWLDPSIFADDQQCWKSIYVVLRQEQYVEDWKAGFGLPVIGIGINKLTRSKNLGIFSSSLDPQTINDPRAKAFDKMDDDVLYKIFNNKVQIVSATLEYSGADISRKNLISSCDKFSSMYDDVANSYIEYSKCGEYIDGAPNSRKASIAACKSKALSKVNDYTDIMTKTCNSILQNQSVSSNDGCADSCLNSIERMKSLKAKYIKKEDYSATCGFSQNLIGWIDNILNIVKYILPVLVIILGIIDFIRAIASDKDDEMKKAQGRFVKRLIAAALAFIIPFIIVFVLEKFGFVVEGCGVINLK